MHQDELEIPLELVSRLVAEQFPAWAELPIEPLLPWGTDNALFRLGEERVVRLPRIAWAAGQVAKDARWLPVLAPRLPVAIPEVLGTGVPSDAYPWTWGVYRWLAGETLPAERIADVAGAAADLARFLAALRRIETTGAHPQGRRTPREGFRWPPVTRLSAERSRRWGTRSTASSPRSSGSRRSGRSGTDRRRGCTAT